MDRGNEKSKTRAAVGVTGIKRIIARIVRKDLYLASSELDVKEWIVKNV